VSNNPPSRKVRADGSGPRQNLRQAMFDVGYFPPNTPPDE